MEEILVNLAVFANFSISHDSLWFGKSQPDINLQHQFPSIIKNYLRLQTA